MPSVPRIQSGQIQETALPTTRVATEAPNLGAEGASRVFGALEKNFAQVRQAQVEEFQKANDTWSQDYYKKAAEHRQAMQSDPKGATAMRGKDAIGAVDTYGKEYSKYLDDLDKSATNEDQRAMASKIRASQEVQWNGFLNQHTARETKQYEIETNKAAVLTTQKDAVLNYLGMDNKPNLALIGEKLGMQESLIRDMGTKEGQDPKLTELQVMDARSKTHTAIIHQMQASGFDIMASDYFNKHADQLGPEEKAALTKSLDESSLRGNSQRQLEDILGQTKDYGQALAMTRKIDDPKLQDATKERVKDYFSTRETVQRLATEDTHKRATDILDRGGNIDDIQKNMPQQWASFSIGERSSLKQYLENQRNGNQAEANGATYYNLRTMAAMPETKAKFLKMNLSDPALKMQMPKTEVHELIELQAGLRKGDADAGKKLDGIRTDIRVADDALRSIGIDPSPKDGSDDAKKVELFYGQVDRAVIDWKKRNDKKEIPNPELKKIVDGLVIQGVTAKGWLFDTKKRTFELEPGENFKNIVVPDADRKEIENQLRKRNKPVTDDEVAKWYVKGRVGG